MRICSVCKTKFTSGSGNLFYVPKDPEKRAMWGEICGKNFAATNLICADHFLPTSIARIGKRMLLLPNAEPSIKQVQKCKIHVQGISTSYHGQSSLPVNNSRSTYVEQGSEPYVAITSDCNVWSDPN